MIKFFTYFLPSLYIIAQHTTFMQISYNCDLLAFWIWADDKHSV